MMHFNEEYIKLLNELIGQGFITKRKHPVHDIWILNYSAKTQYEGVWNDLTLACRGLIIDNEYNIIARPFKKFFNFEEQKHNGTDNFKVYEKLDGSLGIVFKYKGEWIVATRGSFESEQAIKAQSMLRNYNMELLDIIAPNHTWLFEIIYRENKIVVSYDYEGLVMLGAINTETAEELDIHNLKLDDSFKLCKTYNGFGDFSKIKNLISNNEEGFVIRFSNSERCKIKGDEYKRLHKLLTGVSNVTIWEFLSEGKQLNEFLDNVPDEWYDWVKETVKELQLKYIEISKECFEVYKEYSTRKETALYFQTQKYPQILFAMLDRKNIEPIIWKIIKPKWSRPFHENKDE